MPRPFNSRKFMTVVVTLAAIVAVSLTNHASDSVLTAITTVGAGHMGLQSLLDFKHGSKS